MSECPFAEGWENKEGWLIFGDKYVCYDWDDYCTQCMKHDGSDNIFTIGIKREVIVEREES